MSNISIIGTVHFFRIDPGYVTLVSDVGNCIKQDCVIPMTIVKLEK